jgi:hypothetical protein
VIKQRELYILPYTINDKIETHPFIVLSCLEANEHENTFIAVMISSSEITKDDHSFNLSNEMFEKELKAENCHVRMHLIFMCMPEDIKSNRINIMKISYFNHLMKEIGAMIFNYDFSPIQ